MDEKSVRNYVLGTSETEFAMNQKLSERGHSMRMMWGCLAIVLSVVIHR
jgi:hypothetical protein